MSPPIHRARFSLRMGKHARAEASLKLTSAGLLATGALVSSVLLSTAVLVRIAVREGRRRV